MKMPISSSLFMPFTFQCPRKRFSAFINEKFLVAHYIWKIESCSGNEWWKSSTAATICFTVFVALEYYLLFLSSPNHLVPLPEPFILPIFFWGSRWLSYLRLENMLFPLMHCNWEKFSSKSSTRLKIKFFRRL